MADKNVDLSAALGGEIDHLPGRRDLIDIILKSESPCVSIFLPTHRAGAEVQQDPVRFKNLLRRAEEQMTDLGVRKGDTDRVLGPSRRLLEMGDFWRHSKDGLAVLLSPNTFRPLRVPFGFNERVDIGERLRVRPLLPLLGHETEFYVLAISLNAVKLFRAGRFDMSEVDLGEDGISIEQVLGRELEGHSLQFHTGAPPAGAKRAAVYHGQGAGEDDRKQDIVKFLRAIDDTVMEAIENRSAPMVLAAVDYLIPMYRDVSEHPNVLENGVVGNPEPLAPEELHPKAWEAAASALTKPRADKLARLREEAAGERTSDDINKILPSAYDGRVDALFISSDGECRGEFEPGLRTVEIRGTRRTGDDDLYDLAAFLTLAHGGDVYTAGEEEIQGRPISALLRY